MKRLLLIFFLVTCYSYSQEEHAWIYFKDKPNVEAALNNPSTILSSKAIQRKSLRGTPIDERDIPVNEAYISTIKTQENISVKAKSKWMNCVHVIGSLEAISNLSNLGFVSEIEFANKNINSRASVENKKLENKLETNIDFNYGLALNQTKMLSTDYLHENDYTGEGVTIAVMDGGFANVNTIGAFDRLKLNGKLLGGFDFTNRSGNYSNPELSNHGTLVLSNMAGFIENNFVGTAPDAAYYLFITEIGPTETPVEETYWVEAAERADSLGVDLINTSLGYTLFDNPDYSYAPEDMDGKTAFISRGANIATEKGLLIVTSAGNRGEENYFNIISAPADANVLSVGGVDRNRNYVTFSSRGPSADGRVKPDVAAQGLEIVAIDQFNNLVQASGTSFASPILAGSVASFWQADPSLSNLEVMQLVKAASSLFNTPNNRLGYGIPDFRNALSDLLESNQDSGELFLYQNPVVNQLKFNNSTDQTYNITLFDMLGQVILQKDQVQNEIDLSGFSKGIYIAMFEQNNSRQSFLIIKK
ncbi:S8 family serine peptidase [Christiangramia forsetii]|uniref:Subtilisin-like serine protease n=2 Tax=Christiangramia forsetii TaxID=411153 RepID=A0M3J3_CHRFK|nr:S8 family serine peptidase [Christiangramia forsetii]GGG25723.1 peptidase S8 [Christiangramia forsetii]CAL67188.1 subtilisin-like serine protease [Christiangramia forsetii KT0803]